MSNMAFEFHYKTDPAFPEKIAYFCMEYGIHQPLKTYAGGLGFLAGSHMRGAYTLKQPMVGIGILWKYGYYDQVRKQDQSMDVLFSEKIYGFLVPTGLKFTIRISRHEVWVTAYYLPPEIFSTAPVFFLSTDLPENDYLAQTISHKLYDANPETKIASAILLGAGGAKLLELLDWVPDKYHLNESHALPLAFYLYKNSRQVGELRKRLVFTNHTPEASGNQQTSISLLEKMGYFCDVPVEEVRSITGMDGLELDHTLAALRLAGRANAVSELHRQTLCEMWTANSGICEIIAITNAQDFGYWQDRSMYAALAAGDDAALVAAKHAGKLQLFEEVADQNGEIYDPKIFTLVFAKRFAGYKRADLLLHDMDRFHRLVTNAEMPLQVIWAGKPYPQDYAAIGVFDKIVHVCKTYPNCSILSGYELKLSRLLKNGADAWLNVPRLRHEASGTSGMSAAMNGAVNIGLPDGWFPEFAQDTFNAFVVPSGDTSLPEHLQDEADAKRLYTLLEEEIIPTFYRNPKRWLAIMKQGMHDVVPQFDSRRMAREYYEKLYR